MDHFFQIRVSGLPPEAPMLEGYATLVFIAGQTRRIGLGTMVASVSYRHPGVLIKTVTSLDVMSGGRMVLGVGAAAPFNIPSNLPFAEARVRGHEVAGLGIPFPSLAERFERLEELLQIALPHVARRRGAVRGEALPVGKTAQLAGLPAAPPPADPGRRQRRAEDPQTGRTVRRRVQPVRHTGQPVPRRPEP
jgi:alkanesulfonate monooxygenase SsuD/methylene tetrahydromethanopterin reductase-like flavin-dependent oxidoreductase (luciferase family)